MKLTEIYEYDETSPSCLRWKISRGRIRQGDIAGGITAEGYYRVRNLGKKYLAHRIIWEMFNGSIPQGKVVDHINRNKSDNRLTNLRLLDIPDNAHNCNKRLNNTSGVTGVVFEDGEHPRWRATWMHEGRLRTKSFSVGKYGDELAQQSAMSYRELKLRELTDSGVYYSADHGL